MVFSIMLNWIRSNCKFSAKKYTRQELERMDIATLDRMAFGLSNDDLITLNPRQIKIKYHGDLENPRYKFFKGGMDWVRSVDFTQPVDVSFDGKNFFLEDGHHRWFAAKKLGRLLRAKVQVKAKPIEFILRRQEASKE